MLNVVDSHVHFWDPGRLRYAWLDEIPQLNRPHLPDQMPAEGRGWRLEGLVFVQADCEPGQSLLEAEWVASLAAAGPPVQGIVAFAPLELGEGVRPALAELARRPLVKGVRRLIQSEPAGFSVRPGFVAGVRMLAEFNLTCDLCIRHFQLRDVIQLVGQCPQVSFVLDHIGKPDIKNGLREPWQADLAELAAAPNVACKLSGLVTEADPQRWSAAGLQPYIDHALGSFGIERVMFGSDWPVVTLAAAYSQWVETLMAATGSLSNAEREKLFSRNAARFYGLAAS